MNFPRPKEMLRALRAQGLSQEAIGRNIGVSQCAISFLASGKRKDMFWSNGMKLAELYAKVVLNGRIAVVRRRKKS